MNGSNVAAKRFRRLGGVLVILLALVALGGDGSPRYAVGAAPTTLARPSLDGTAATGMPPIAAGDDTLFLDVRGLVKLLDARA
jgi:hypothetical protein